MRQLAVLFTLLLVAGPAAGQWLETTIDVGANPAALCYNDPSEKVYCANSGSGNVTVIDGATNAVIMTVATGDRPIALCYNPTNNKVYGANSGDYPSYDSTASVIDGAGDSLVKTIIVGDGPCAFAWNPARSRTYVANGGGSSIAVLRDSGGGIEESFRPQAASFELGPTIVRGVLWIGERGRETRERVELMDISGRKVLDLVPGANDVRHLSPGVYFCRQTAGSGACPATGTENHEPRTTAKVVVTR